MQPGIKARLHPTILAAVVIAVAASNIAPHLLAQAISMSGTPNGETNVPIPGVGHDYIHLLAETVDPSSGSVNLRIDFPTPKSRGITIPFSLSYSSAGIFRLQTISGGPYLYPNCDSGYTFNSSCGWQYIYPTSQFLYSQIPLVGADGVSEGTKNSWTDYVFTDSEGVSHNLGLGYQCVEGADFGPCATVSTAIHTDGAVYAQWTPPATIYTLMDYSVFDQRGTTYSFTSGLDTGPPSLIEDRNGNETYPSLTSTGTETHTFTLLFPDTAGRTAVSVVGNETPGTFDTVIAGGLTFKVYYTAISPSYSMSANSPEPAGVGCDSGNFTLGTDTTETVLSAVSQILLPDGRKYSFFYGENNPDTSLNNPYGLLNEILYPDGGWVKYIYRQSDSYSLGGSFASVTTTAGNEVVTPNSCIYQYSTPVLDTRTVSFDGINVAQTMEFTNYSTTFSTSNDTTSVRLEVEQNQLFAGLRWIGIGETLLKGA